MKVGINTTRRSVIVGAATRPKGPPKGTSKTSKTSPLSTERTLPPKVQRQGGGGSGPSANGRPPKDPKFGREQRDSTFTFLATGVAAIGAALLIATSPQEIELLRSGTSTGLREEAELGVDIRAGAERDLEAARSAQAGGAPVVEVPATDDMLSAPKPKSPESATSARELFNPVLYQGRWYEVASMKLGFAGEGQQDCHCTTGIYRLAPGKKDKLNVSTFCVHGSPKGRISGLQGAVTCADPAALRLLPEFQTPLERKEGIVEKCVLRFPSLPFIPAETYDIVATDYTSYALVQGSPDQSFIQIYSRTPNPGRKFIDDQKAYLKSIGYDISLIKDTPQDCSEINVDKLVAMMDASKGNMEIGQTPTGEFVPLEEAADNTFKLSGIAINPINPVESLKDLKTLVEETAKSATGQAN